MPGIWHSMGHASEILMPWSRGLPAYLQRKIGSCRHNFPGQRCPSAGTPRGSKIAIAIK